MRRGLLIVSLLLGCGSEEWSPEIEAEAFEPASQALTESSIDRPGAAAVFMHQDDRLWLWLFVCGQDNNMYRRRAKVIGGFKELSWQSGFEKLATNFTCASQPTVGRWGGRLDATHGVAVYWRSTNNKLIEGWYDPNGTGTFTDVSTYTGFGSISGSPLIVDANSSETWLTIAVKQATTNKLYTIDWYQDAYRVKPMKRFDGSTAVGINSVFSGHYADDGSGVAYVSMKVSPTEHVVFSHGSWTNGFTEYATMTSLTASVTPSLLTIGRGMLHEGIPGGACSAECAFAVLPKVGGGRGVFWASLSSASGELGPFNLLEYVDSPRGPVSMAAAAYSAPTNIGAGVDANGTGYGIDLGRWTWGQASSPIASLPVIGSYAPHVDSQYIFFFTRQNANGTYGLCSTEKWTDIETSLRFNALAP